MLIESCQPDNIKDALLENNLVLKSEPTKNFLILKKRSIIPVLSGILFCCPVFCFPALSLAVVYCLIISLKSPVGFYSCTFSYKRTEEIIDFFFPLLIYTSAVYPILKSSWGGCLNYNWKTKEHHDLNNASNLHKCSPAFLFHIVCTYDGPASLNR